ncbi:3-hydroxyisobutyrate dehydrogenase/2-hydroxy-3-oxopropionate reductase [Tenggerimyces flavus]|nr:NAD(P)-dependent oxidoreductase [Tenggerimyces flavus]MBM7791226.1 3-hydroxyisobutyrate dehydrogenase/2-hydroxy-3-oxopropionate reductase [Tenggerimyces flavus]
MIGTGRMGAAMVGRLRGAGHPVVVWNRTPARAKGLDADVAATAAEAAAAADVVLVSLADDAAVLAMYEGPDGLVAGLRPGTIVVDTSTVAPATVRKAAALVAERGAVLLDAPVSGSVPVVQQGAITFLVGGPADALDKVRPILSAFATRIFHLGDVGSGATMKLSVNSVVYGLNQSVAEALVLAEKAGVERAVAYEVFANSAISAPFVHYKRESFERPAETPAAFMLQLVVKDLDLIGALADEVGARMDQRATNRKLAAEALADGLGERDLSVVAEFLRRQHEADGQ